MSWERIRFFLFGCAHRWKRTNRYETAYAYEAECEKCGVLRRVSKL